MYNIEQWSIFFVLYVNHKRIPYGSNGLQASIQLVPFHSVTAQVFKIGYLLLYAYNFFSYNYMQQIVYEKEIKKYLLCQFVF